MPNLLNWSSAHNFPEKDAVGNHWDGVGLGVACVQDNHSEIVAANDIVADSVDLDLVDAIAVLYHAEVAAAIDVLDIAEAVDSPDLALVFAAILVLDPGKTEVAIAESAVVVHKCAVAVDNFDLPFAINCKDFENV